MIVADASPLVALALCEGLSLLDQLFVTINVSQVVYEEIAVVGKPQSQLLKSYLQGKVVEVDLSEIVTEGASLDKGELSSIRLCKQLKADYLLMDEKVGRRIAKAILRAVINDAFL